MTDYRSQGGTERRRTRWTALLLPLAAFVAGLAAMGWLLTEWRAAASFLGIAPPLQLASPAPARPPAPAMAAAVPAPAEPQTLLIDPDVQQRVRQLERRVAEIDSQSRAAVGNADRAEGLLVAFAARRALDRGVALGYIEGLLRDRFGGSERQAVATIITASRTSVTLEELQDGLQELGPSLAGGGRAQGWWSALRTEVGGLVTVRRAGTTSTMPAERLRRATRRVEAGQVDVALAEVLRMPGRDNGRAWIADARRYVSARRALDSIETAALLAPHEAPASPRSPVAPR